jgi:hypothetical protein
MAREIGLSDVFGAASEIVSGAVRGRIVVKIG